MNAVNKDAPKSRKNTQNKSSVGVPENSQTQGQKSSGKLALILLRGIINVRQDIKDTLFNLRLRKKHACVLLEDTPSNRKRAIKCKDYLTFGELDQATLTLLAEKRAKQKGSDTRAAKIGNNESEQKYYNLSPPRGGFEKKGIKKPYSSGGALGYRGNSINKLICKMV